MTSIPSVSTHRDEDEHRKAFKKFRRKRQFEMVDQNYHDEVDDDTYDDNITPVQAKKRVGGGQGKLSSAEERILELYGVTTEKIFQMKKKRFCDFVGEEVKKDSHKNFFKDLRKKLLNRASAKKSKMKDKCTIEYLMQCVRAKEKEKEELEVTLKHKKSQIKALESKNDSDWWRADCPQLRELLVQRQNLLLDSTLDFYDLEIQKLEGSEK